MKILITGGHLTPALAVIDKIQLQKRYQKEIKNYFVERKHALDTKKTISFEYKEILLKNLEFIDLDTGRFTRIFNLKSLRSLIKIPLGFVRAFQILTNIKPDNILSFGGYIALPIVIIGWLLRIPVYTHEQTIFPGLSNRIISLFAKKIFYSFERSAHYFPKNKAIYSGNPIRNSVFSVLEKPFEIKNKLPSIYITGGSLGSHSINIHILNILNLLLERYNVIHQIGDVKEYNDFETCIKAKNLLSFTRREQYIPVKHFLASEIGYIYSIADIVVGRSGANTFFELLQLKKPAILIPLPWSANQEQQIQAKLFEMYGLGFVFEQKNKSEKLFELINLLYRDRAKYLNHFYRLSIVMKQDAADCIIQEILKNN